MELRYINTRKVCHRYLLSTVIDFFFISVTFMFLVNKHFKFVCYHNKLSHFRLFVIYPLQTFVVAHFARDIFHFLTDAILQCSYVPTRFRSWKSPDLVLTTYTLSQLSTSSFRCLELVIDTKRTCTKCCDVPYFLFFKKKLFPHTYTSN